MRTLSQEVIKRQAVEKKVIRAFVKDALAAGHLISVYDGEAFALKRTDKITEIMKALMSTDEDYLFIYNKGEKERIGWVHCVYGNDGWDVISDYTTNLEPLMQNAQKVSDKECK